MPEHRIYNMQLYVSDLYIKAILTIVILYIEKYLIYGKSPRGYKTIKDTS